MKIGGRVGLGGESGDVMHAVDRWGGFGVRPVRRRGSKEGGGCTVVRGRMVGNRVRLRGRSSWGRGREGVLRGMKAIGSLGLSSNSLGARERGVCGACRFWMVEFVGVVLTAVTGVLRGKSGDGDRRGGARVGVQRG